MIDPFKAAIDARHQEANRQQAAYAHALRCAGIFVSWSRFASTPPIVGEIVASQLTPREAETIETILKGIASACIEETKTNKDLPPDARKGLARLAGSIGHAFEPRAHL